MKNPPDKTRQEAENLTEDYLDHFCAPLIGAVPYSERTTLRRELASHVEALAMEYEWQGNDPVQSARFALSEMGEPWAAGESWLVEWNAGKQVQSSSSRLARAMLTRPFGFFGAATMVNLLALEYYMRTPDNTVLPPHILVLIMLSPILAGVLTGYQQSAHLLRSIVIVLLFLAFDSFVTGILMLPKNEILLFAAVQIVVWIPFGIGTAYLTAALVRSHRRHSFLRMLKRAK